MPSVSWRSEGSPTNCLGCEARRARANRACRQSDRCASGGVYLAEPGIQVQLDRMNNRNNRHRRWCPTDDGSSPGILAILLLVAMVAVFAMVTALAGPHPSVPKAACTVGMPCPKN
jgi:hypothetical protein